jgi:hypothetical protein
LGKTKDDSLEFRNEIVAVTKNMSNHKKEHCNMTTDDIVDITKKFDKYCKKIFITE